MDKSKVIDNKVLLIFLVGFIIRFVWLYSSRPEPVSDFLEYKQLAENILNNHIIGWKKIPSAYRLPLYPIFLSFFMLFNKSDFFLSLINVILSSFIPVLLYIIVVQTFNDIKLALLVSLLCVLNPTFIFFSPVLASENLFAILLLLSIIFTIEFIKREGFLFLLFSSISLGLSSLTRGESVFYVPAIILYIWGFINLGFKKKIQNIVLFLMIFVMIISPWILRNKIIFGTAGLSSTSGINFYYAHNPNGYGCVLEAIKPLEKLDILRVTFFL